jgi:hypothetical protein
VTDQRLDVGRGREPFLIDDEIGVLFRNARAADRKSFESAALDQARSVIAFRIAEYRSRVWQAERLGRNALRQQRLDAPARIRAIARRKVEPRRGERDVVRTAPADDASVADDVAPAGGVGIRLAGSALRPRRHRARSRAVAAAFIASAADRAGNAGKEFRVGPVVARRSARPSGLRLRLGAYPAAIEPISFSAACAAQTVPRTPPSRTNRLLPSR